MYELYIKQKAFKITDHYDVLDENQAPVYHVDQDFKFFGNTVHVKRIDGTPAFTINKKIFSLMPHYDIDFHNGKTAVIRQNFTFFKKDIDIISEDFTLKLVGNFWDLEFSVFSTDEEVGKIFRKAFSFGDSFVIQVINPEFEEALLALLIAVDNIQDESSK